MYTGPSFPEWEVKQSRGSSAGRCTQMILMK